MAAKLRFICESDHPFSRKSVVFVLSDVGIARLPNLNTFTVLFTIFQLAEIFAIFSN